MGALSKLDAVNRILKASGEYPVSTLSITGSNDVVMAVQTLDEAVIQAQLPGLNCNTAYVDMYPDADGKIKIADDVISIDTHGIDVSRNIVSRGRNPTYLFDVDNNTDEFEIGKSIRVRVVYNLKFEDLPTAEQFMVTDLAARMYQMASVGDVNQDRILQEMAIVSRAVGRAADMRSIDGGFTKNTKSAWSFIGSRRTQGPSY